MTSKLREMTPFFTSVISLSFLIAPLFLFSTSLASTQDGLVLTRFMASVDLDQNVLVNNWTGADPCVAHWQGVDCTGPDVTSLILDFMPLGGSLPDNTLSQLLQLRILSLNGNQLTGILPSDLANCTQLKSLYMDGNKLSGEIPSPLSKRLKKLHLSDNLLNGTIPPALADLPRLLTLHLENNLLTGSIPAFNQATLSLFNISNNKLEGRIPVTQALSRFSKASFTGNPLLCGNPMPPCVSKISDPTEITGPSKMRRKKSLGTGAIVGIVIGDACLLLFVTFLFLYYYRMRYTRKTDTQSGSKVSPAEGLSNGAESSMYDNTLSQEDRKPRLVLFEDQYTFRLEDLLRSSAEFLGKGSLGPVYKAIMENGTVVAVKRLKDLNCADQKEFVQEMELVGRLRHPNVVPLWAYYYAKEEKLLVYEYQPNGSLFALLHGNPRSFNPDQKPLSWNARLRIARGVALGLAYIHHECESQRTPHGNIKASNILINKNFEACIADFGLATLVNSSNISPRIVGYKAPEYEHTRKISQKADVYSFGVLLLELLTGKMAENSNGTNAFTLPQWVNSVVRQEWTTEVFDPKLASSRVSEEAMVSMLQIAVSCVSKSPEQRPKMSQVAKMIEDIKEEEYAETYSSADRSLIGSETPDSHFSFY